MNLYIAIPVALIICLTVFAILFKRLCASPSVVECDIEWARDFSVAKYAPMMRLLVEDDFEFISGQAGYSKEIAKRLRTERRKAFRGYLRNMSGDFNRLQLTGKMMLVYGSQDRPELAAQLVRQRAEFTTALLNVHFQLALHSMGMGKVDVRAMLGSMESLRFNVGQLVPAQASAAA